MDRALRLDLCRSKSHPESQAAQNTTFATDRPPIILLVWQYAKIVKTESISALVVQVNDWEDWLQVVVKPDAGALASMRPAIAAATLSALPQSSSSVRSWRLKTLGFLL